MKIDEVRKIKSIESESLKLSKNDSVKLSSITCSPESLAVEMKLFDDDLGGVNITIEAKSLKQIENLKTILEMIQGSV